MNGEDCSLLAVKAPVKMVGENSTVVALAVPQVRSAASATGGLYYPCRK
jgi:hypothetical protein